MKRKDHPSLSLIIQDCIWLAKQLPHWAGRDAYRSPVPHHSNAFSWSPWHDITPNTICLASLCPLLLLLNIIGVGFSLCPLWPVIGYKVNFFNVAISLICWVMP